MSSTSASPATSSYSDLFPTSSGSSSADDGSKTKTSTNVYYLVFLGVLVILMLIALCLTVRAMRLRRRYRTATQMALARGDPIPETLREDFWGFSGLTGWTSDGWDRFGAVRPGDEARRDKKPKWERVPVLKEAVVEMEKEKVESETIWDSIQPLTLHSLRPPADTPAAPEFAGSGTRPPLPQPSSYRSRSQNGIFNFRNYPPPPTSSVFLQGRSRSRQRPAEDAELNRSLEPGEPLLLAVIIQMPTLESRPQKYRTEEMTEEEEVAWEGGMELGVWEGVVGGDGKTFQRESTVKMREDGESEMEGRGGGLVRSRSEESFANGDIGSYR